MRFRDLKKEAKASLKGNWKTAIGVEVIFFLISIAISLMYVMPYMTQFVNNAILMDSMRVNDPDIVFTMVTDIYRILGISEIVMIIVSIFVLAPISVGYLNVFLKIARREETSVKGLFSIFSSRYLPCLKTYLWQILFIFLWMLLLVPAIILIVLISSIIALLGDYAASIVVVAVLYIAVILGLILIISRYAMTFYVFLDNPENSFRENLNESKRLMKGNIWRYIGFSFSFIGWILLCVLVVPILYVDPYIQTSMANFYRSLKGEYNIAAASEEIPVQELPKEENSEDADE